MHALGRYSKVYPQNKILSSGFAAETSASPNRANIKPSFPQGQFSPLHASGNVWVEIELSRLSPEQEEMTALTLLKQTGNHWPENPAFAGNGRKPHEISSYFLVTSEACVCHSSRRNLCRRHLRSNPLNHGCIVRSRITGAQGLQQTGNYWGQVGLDCTRTKKKKKVFVAQLLLHKYDKGWGPSGVRIKKIKAM